MTEVDWGWKLREAAERIRTRNEHIGRKTGAAFSPSCTRPRPNESSCEWHVLAATLAPEFEVRAIDVLDVTMRGGRPGGSGIDEGPHAGLDPGVRARGRLGRAVVADVRTAAGRPGSGVPHLSWSASLPVPGSGSRVVVQALWDSDQAFDCPLILFGPGRAGRGDESIASGGR
jgi:hypothetical protein